MKDICFSTIWEAVFSWTETGKHSVHCDNIVYSSLSNMLIIGRWVGALVQKKITFWGTCNIPKAPNTKPNNCQQINEKNLFAAFAEGSILKYNNDLLVHR